jgi:NTP pyrophosphatase (non-canonical NTP hydrolase)
MNFYEYQEESRKTWIFDHNNDFMRSVLGICGEAGEIAEKVKKDLRGDYKLTPPEICKELGDLLYYIARVADYYKLDLHTIAVANIKKLQSRKERGKIKGNGDNR